MDITGTKKPILIVLALSVVICTSTGCKSGVADGGGQTTESTTGEATETHQGTTEKAVADYLPDADYGGYEFRGVTIPHGMLSLISSFDIEAETGDVVDDAIYKRNRIVEARYNVIFKELYAKDLFDLTTIFKRSSMADSDDFDLGMMIGREAWKMALEGFVVPVHRLPFLDVSRAWYSHEINDSITIGGKMFFAYSDECLNMFEQTLCVLFNKNLASELALENMYNLVNTNKWVWDKFYELAKTAAADTNGDGVMTDEDRYGIVTQTDMIYPCSWVSSGINIIGKDENGNLAFNGGSQKMSDLIDKVHGNLFSGTKIMFDSLADKVTTIKGRGGDAGRDISTQQFANDNALFYVIHIGMIPALRSMDTDFGILPCPKYDETQEKFYSRIIDGWPNCVSVSNRDLERTSVIMEALAVESRNIIKPAYFEVALKYKHARDDESAEMLEIIHRGRTLDLGDAFNNEIQNIFNPLFNSKYGKTASEIEKNSKKINDYIEKINEAAAKLD